MTIFGIDYAWSRPTVANMNAAGVKFAARYLSHDTTGKNITRAEADKLAKAGIWSVLVWETTASRAKTGGRAGGEADAKQALSMSRALNLPDDRPIYFAVDYDAPRADWTRIKAYFQGVRDVLPLGRIGMYAGYDPIRWAFDDKIITWGWQTYAWSEGKWDTRAQLQQYRNGVSMGGADVDYDRATVPDYGQFMPGKSPAAPEPEAPTVPKWPGRLITQPPAMSGDDVKTWQTQMRKRGWNLTVDGTFSARDEEILRAFQEEKGLTVDGVLGPMSWRAAWTAKIT